MSSAGSRSIAPGDHHAVPSGRSAAPLEVFMPIAVIALAAAVFFIHLGSYGLWEPDEARYAEIAREMLATRQFLVPHLNYVPYLEKPPLLYWLTAGAMWLVGINEWGARLINALAAFTGVLATYGFVRRTFDRRRAAMAAAVLATSGLYAVMAQVLTTDMLLTALMTIAFFGFFLGWREGGRWFWLAYLATGLAVLTKGPVGAVLPGLVAIVFLWREGELRALRTRRGWGEIFHRYRVIAGLLLIAIVAAPWFIAITLREPGFFDFYFIGEHVRRFLEPNYSHREPFYYYLPVMLAGLLPWTLMVPLIPWRQAAPAAARRYCVIAVLVIFVFFSCASAKLVPYILPALPPLAVVIGDGLVTLAESRAAGRLAAAGPILGILGAIAMVVALYATRFRSPYPLLVRGVLQATAALLCVGGLACFVACVRGYRTVGLALFALTTAGVLIASGYGRLAAEPTRSYAELARAIAARAPDATLICYPRYIQSLPFYCRRRVILVGPPTELAYGAAHAADASQYFFSSRADLLRLWDNPRPSVLIIDRSALPGLRASLGPYRIIAADHKKLALMRASAAPGTTP